jgi:hypothetical protein
MRIHKLALIALLAACGSSAKSTPTAKPVATDDPSCPVSVPGTSVTVEDTAGGAALVFVTTGDTAELRKRVASMATMHNDHHGKMGPLPDGKDAGGHAGHDAHAGHAGHGGGEHAGHGGGEHAGHAGGMIGVHSKATSVEIESGAKLAFVAGAADVGKLQSELRMHAQHLASGTCKMGQH